MDEDHPVEDLQPGSWTEAEVDAMEGHRVRFHDGHTGIAKNAASFGAGGEILGYGVDVTPDGGETTFLTKGDAEAGDWAFTVLPDRVSEEERAALPEWGHKP